MNAALLEHDSFDERAFAEVSEGSARLEALRERGAKLLPHFDALLFDLFAALFKLNVRLRPDALTPQSARLGRRLLTSLLESPGYAALKEQTALDEFRAAMGAAELGEQALRLVARQELVDAEDLAKMRALADREEEIGRLREELGTLQELGHDRSEAARDLEREIDVTGDEIAELSQDHQELVEDLPPALETTVEQRVERLTEEVQQADERIEAWGSGLGAPERLSAAERLELGERLVRNPNLQRLAKMVGAMRELALAQRRRRFERTVDEVHTVRAGRELARLLPAELIYLRHPLRRADFLRRYTEGELLAYDLRGNPPRGRGPLVVCLDGSSSMAGDKELWSKAVALTLLEIARREGRAFRVVYFSSRDAEPRRFDCIARARPGRKAVGRAPVTFPEVVALCEYFPGGGTDFERPLEVALATLEEAPFRGGDVVLVTDGECEVSGTFAERFSEARRRLDFRLFAVEVDVGTHRGDSIRRLADKVTSVTRLTGEPLKDLFREV